ncbi:unnamed protein product [Phaedon cochleariae]|uniref:Uncharacterized protein n=1 Tax=Phaedon cochleariae TaxID=80249 RepID=A0A9N9SJV6_PHACE|nr:unnamed protein product [Phaedon cochleariae]
MRGSFMSTPTVPAYRIESLSHALQQCPATHWERIRRHNKVVKKVAGLRRKKQWTTKEAPHVRHQDGTLIKPDLVVHHSTSTLVVDVGAARQRWPGKASQVLPIIVGDWSRCNGPTDEALNTGVEGELCAKRAQVVLFDPPIVWSAGSRVSQFARFLPATN